MEIRDQEWKVAGISTRTTCRLRLLADDQSELYDRIRKLESDNSNLRTQTVQSENTIKVLLDTIKKLSSSSGTPKSPSDIDIIKSNPTSAEASDAFFRLHQKVEIVKSHITPDTTVPSFSALPTDRIVASLKDWYIPLAEDSRHRHFLGTDTPFLSKLTSILSSPILKLEDFELVLSRLRYAYLLSDISNCHIIDSSLADIPVDYSSPEFIFDIGHVQQASQVLSKVDAAVEMVIGWLTVDKRPVIFTAHSKLRTVAIWDHDSVWPQEKVQDVFEEVVDSFPTLENEAAEWTFVSYKPVGPTAPLGKALTDNTACLLV
jgi:hypothetical protein